MSVFQNNWGLTDYLKSEFQIRVKIHFADKCDVEECSPDEAQAGGNQTSLKADLILI